MDVSRKIFTQLFNTELVKQNCEPFSSKEKKKKDVYVLDFSFYLSPTMENLK